MQVSNAWKVAGIAALGMGAVALATFAGCSAQGEKTDGPMGDLSAELMKTLVPSWKRGGLDVATQGTRAVTRDNGSVQGTYDGTRLLRAADAHSYGTPQIGDPAVDVASDGKATFNEVREVVRHFDADSSGAFDLAETRSFESEVGIRWVAGTN